MWLINSDNPDGRYNLQRKMIEAENFSRQLSRKMKDRSLAAVKHGRWPRAAPVVYRNADRNSLGANVKSDPNNFGHVRRAFELGATARFTEAALLRQLTEEGLRDRRGKRLSPQTFHAMLRNRFYCGYVGSKKHGIEVKGLHEPCISEDLFNKVQRVLSGKGSTAPKRKLNPALPLKNFIRCDECGTKMTGGLSRSQTGRKYGYYRCRNPHCRAVKIGSPFLEDEFRALLKRLVLTQETLKFFPTLGAKIWTEMQGDVDKKRKRLMADLNELRGLKSSIVKLRANGELSPEEFAEENGRYTQQISAIQEELTLLDSVCTKKEAFMRFLEVRLMNIAEAWDKADISQKYKVQTLLFSDGLRYSQKSNSLNFSNSSLFSHLNAETRADYQIGVPDGI